MLFNTSGNFLGLKAQDPELKKISPCPKLLPETREAGIRLGHTREKEGSVTLLLLLTYLVQARKQGQSCKGVCEAPCDMASPCPRWAWACRGHVKTTRTKQQASPLGLRLSSQRHHRGLPQQKGGRWSPQHCRSSGPTNPHQCLSVPARDTCTCSSHPFGETDLAGCIPDSINIFRGLLGSSQC